jgi:hypothetical protein
MRTSTISVQNVKGHNGHVATDKVTGSATATPHRSIVFGSLGSVGIAALVMCLVRAHLIHSQPMMFAAGYIPLAGVVAVSAGLERLLEPIASIWNPPGSGTGGGAVQATQAAESAAADPEKSDADVAPLVQDAADKQAQLRADKTVFYWAFATICGLVISGCFGLVLLQAVSTTQVNKYLDLVVTGLVIGAGTKPVHDLIVGIQSK